MKNIYPLYCNSFKCIAGACPDTCCAQWEIVIDEKYVNLYKSHHSDAAKDAVSAMYTDSDGDTCLRLTNGRCPMLNGENLCRLYIEMGEDALCDVCRIYPRFNKDAEQTNFCGISLSCPEAARLILGDENMGQLNETPQFENMKYGFVFKAYELFRKLCKDGCFMYSLPLAESVQDEIDFDDLSEAERILDKSDFSFDKQITEPGVIAGRIRQMLAFDILKNSWRDTLSNLLNHLEALSEDESLNKEREIMLSQLYTRREIKNIEIYYLYKYLPEAVEYSDIYTCVSTAVACTELICELCAMRKLCINILETEHILEFSKDFSKEIEHNGDNMGKFCKLIEL